MFSAKKTVSSIMSAFTKTIAELEAVEQASKQEAKDKGNQAAALLQESKEAEKEASRARSVAEKLKTLIEAPAQ